MVVDTSAIIAILNAEPEAQAFVATLAGASACRISAASFVEAGLVARRDPTGAWRQALEQLVTDYAIQIDQVTEHQARIALDAYRSEEHTSELQSLMRHSYAVFCLKKKTIHNHPTKKKLHIHSTQTYHEIRKITN